MKFDVNIGQYSPTAPVRIGNVYPVRGGRGASLGHLQVLIAMGERSLIQGPTCYFLVINREGEARGVNSYALHYVEGLVACGFVEGLENLNLEITSI